MHKGKLLLLRFNGQLLNLHITENRLISVQVYDDAHTSLVGNIYVGKIQTISSNIQAAFVEIEKGNICFLPLTDVKNPLLINRIYNGRFCAGDELLVQVKKDAIKTKQPVLTTNIAISGNFMVASYGSGKLGLSSKLSASKKQEIIDYLENESMIDDQKQCCFIDNAGIIIRTNASELEDLSILKSEWMYLKECLGDILNTYMHRTCFSCLYKSEQPYLSDLKNYYTKDYDEIVTDCEDIYHQITDFYERQNLLSGISKPIVRFYQDEYSLEKLYSVKTLLDDAVQSRVWLKSGGYLVIEPTEALTVIDVNTGKYEAKKDKEETFYSINLEAAKEIAHQLRLRNISGIIIVDFINMSEAEHQRNIFKKLEEYLKLDTVTTNVIDMTPLGLVEITRKRVNRPLKELLKTI